MKGKTVIISGNVSDSGLSVAKACAEAGANVLLLLSDEQATRYETTDESKVRHPGVQIKHCDISNSSLLEKMLGEVSSSFDGIDIVINNIGVVLPMNTAHIEMPQYDLMHNNNVRNAFLMSQLCHPLLRHSNNPQIINISPPLDIDPIWFKEHLAFGMSAFAMSMCTLGMAAEFKKSGIRVNSIWPKDCSLVDMNELQQAEFAKKIIELATSSADGTGQFYRS